MLTIVPTIDTEGMHGSRPFEQFILGRVDTSEEEWGAFRIAEICARHGAQATFFVDVYERSFWGEAAMRDLCRGLVDAGADVQLHTHPGWRDDPHDFPSLRALKRERSYLSPQLDFMAKLSLDQQEKLLRDGMDMIESWTGRRPVAHRSGGYSVNADTVIALKRVGIVLDSSMYFGHAHSQVSWSRNAVVERDGLLELPVTLMDYTFRLPWLGAIYRKSMKTDLDSCTLEEMIAYVDSAVASGVTLMNLFMHSYSLLKYDQDYLRITGDPVDAQKLDAFLAVMSKRKDVRVLSCAQVVDRYRQDPKSFAGPDIVPEIQANGRIAMFALAKARNAVHQRLRQYLPVPEKEAAASQS